MVTVVLVLDQNNRVLIGPEFYSRGVTFDEVEPELLEGVRIEVEEKLSYLDPQSLQDWENSKDEIRLAVRRNINRVLGRKPLVQTIILQAQ
jgi:mRNA degradation ribonuclease J1/J2